MITDTICVKMKERDPKPVLNRRFSRRQVVRGLAKGIPALIAGSVAARVDKLIIPGSSSWGYTENIDDETRQKLLQFKPITVAHNGANNSSSLQESINAGVNFVEVDVRESFGRLVVQHSNHKTRLFLDEVVRFTGLEDLVRLAGIYKTNPDLEEVVQQIIPSKQRLFIELKQDSTALTNKVVKAVDKYGLEKGVAFFAVDWESLDRIQEKIRPDNLFYTIGNNEQLRLFLDQQRQKKRKGVSLDISLVRKDIVERLQETDAVVLAAVVNSTAQALEVLPTGADGIVSESTSLLSVWSEREPEPNYV